MSAAWQPILTGIPLWLLHEYVEQVGGRPDDDGWLHGPGWRVRLTRADDDQIGALRVGQVRLDVQGSAEGVRALRRAITPKLLRAGG